MKPYLATFSRGIWLYVPVLLLMLAASATGTYYLSGQQYQAVARIWVDKSALDSVLAQNPGGYVPPPAKQQADKMSQLLQTDAFVAVILNHSNLAAQLTGVPDHDGKIIAGVRKQLDVSTIGNNTVKIAFSGTDPVLCQQIVQGTIDQYRNWSLDSQVEQKSVELQYYQKQLKIYEDQVNDATHNVEEFENENPHLDPGSPAYLELQRLQRELESAQGLYRTTQGKIDQADLIDSLSDQNRRAEFQILDKPTVPQLPITSLKKVAQYLVMGMAASVGLVVAAVVLVTWQDTTVRTVDDLETLTDLPVLQVVPHVKARRWWDRQAPDARDVDLGTGLPPQRAEPVRGGEAAD